MKVISTVRELQQEMKLYTNQTVGLVPTMGALHGGHLELIRNAREQNDIVIVSIFVNPTQFNDPNDYKNYPREIQSDRLKCEGAKVDIIFAPSVDEIYGRTGGITFDAGPASKILCGASREGHFEGVLQIVSKLFMLIKPQRAYFGQKDAQQLALIEMLVRDYYFPIQIVGVPIVRERDGLASSSRNVFLTEKQREEALLLHETLSTIRASYKKGENVETLIATSIQNIHQQTTATVEYLELLNYPNLTRDLQPNQQKVLAIAVNFPTVRLIDNSIF